MKSAKITSIDPPNKATIPIGTTTLKITYEIPVLLSNRNISIFQIDGQDVRTRQIASGEISEFYSIDDDKKVITVNVLPSTFNVQNGEYRIYIGANFVKHNETSEPINKFPHSSWMLHTGILLFYIIVNLFVKFQY